MKSSKILLASFLLCLTSSTSFAVTVFSENFEVANSAAFSGGNLVSTQGYSSVGFGNGFLRNGGNGTSTTSLNLSGLPSHSSLTITFDLAIIDSWDGSDPGVGPDRFQLALDSLGIFSETFTSTSLGFPQTNTQLPTASGNYGFNGSWQDAAYSFTFTVPHSAANASFAFSATGLQELDDESWAIDNIRVEAAGGTGSSVPDSGGTLALMALSVAGLARMKKRSA